MTRFAVVDNVTGDTLRTFDVEGHANHLCRGMNSQLGGRYVVRPVATTPATTPAAFENNRCPDGFENDVAGVLSELINAVDGAPDIDFLIYRTVEKIAALAGFRTP